MDISSPVSASDWIRGLAREASAEPAKASSTLLSSAHLELERASPQAMAADLLELMESTRHAPAGLSLLRHSYLKFALGKLASEGDSALNEWERSAMYLAKESAEIAKRAGYEEPRGRAFEKMLPEIDKQAKFELDKARGLAAPKPSLGKKRAEDSEDDKELSEAKSRLEEKLGEEPEGLSKKQVLALDAAMAKLEEKGPDALAPLESAALFAHKASAEIATKHGFQPPPPNEKAELYSDRSLTDNEQIQLRKASQYNQEAGVAIARGVSFSDYESHAERASKVEAYSSVVEAGIPSSAAKGLEQIGQRVREIRDVESQIHPTNTAATPYDLPDAPTPYSNLSKK